MLSILFLCISQNICFYNTMYRKQVSSKIKLSRGTKAVRNRKKYIKYDFLSED